MSTSIAPPFVVPTPTDWGPLKNITSLGSDSNFVVLTGILILLFRASTLDPAVCATPVCLSTLITFLASNRFNTCKNSMSASAPTFPEPIFIEPPIATLDGILFTWISWIKPFAAPIVIVFASPTESVPTPTLNELVKFTIELLNPDMDTDVWSFNSINGKNCAVTSS